MLGFGPFCLDLGHIAWIWAIWQNLGQNRPQRRQSPEDGAGGMNGWTDGRTDGQTDFISFRAAALLPLNLNHTLLKQGTGTADHLLPLGCYLGLHHAQGHIFSLFLLSFTLLRLHSKILKVLEEKSYYS